jgi:hypothetical protein
MERFPQPATMAISREALLAHPGHAPKWLLAMAETPVHLALPVPPLRAQAQADNKKAIHDWKPNKKRQRVSPELAAKRAKHPEFVAKRDRKAHHNRHRATHPAIRHQNARANFCLHYAHLQAWEVDECRHQGFKVGSIGKPLDLLAFLRHPAAPAVAVAYDDPKRAAYRPT